MFDALFERQQLFPGGLEREAEIRQAARQMLAYLPYKLHHWRRDGMLDQPGWNTPPLRPIYYRW